MIKLTMLSGNEIISNDSNDILSFSNGTIKHMKIAALKSGSWVGIKEAYKPLNVPLIPIVDSFPKLINEDVAYLIGLISGDGYVSYEPKIRFFNKNLTLLHSFCNLIDKYFGLKTKPIQTRVKRNGKYYSWYTCNVYSKVFKEFLHINFQLNPGKKNLYLRIPANILGSEKKIIASYLAGLFDADGTVVVGSKNIKFEFVAKNKDFAIDIHKALRVLGASSIIRKDNVNRVRITSVNEIRKIKDIPIRHPKKRFKLNKITRSVKCADFKAVGKTISSERKRADFSQDKLARILNMPRSNLLSYEYGSCLASVNTLKLIGKVLNSSKISSIAKSKKYKDMKAKRKAISMRRKTTNLYILPKNITKNIFSEIIDRHSLSQGQISQMLNTSQGRIGCYCRGVSGISINNLRQLSKIVKTNSTCLFDDSIYWDKVIKVERQ